jgi:hypothetical protein
VYTQAAESLIDTHAALNVRDPRKPRGGFRGVRTVAGMEGGYSKRLQKQFRPPPLKGSHTPTHRRSGTVMVLAPKFALERAGVAPTPHVAPTPGALSRNRGDRLHTSRSVEGRRVGARTHGVQHHLHAHRSHGGGRRAGAPAHRRRVQHRAWPFYLSMETLSPCSCVFSE